MTTLSKGYRDKLANVRGQLRDLRDERVQVKQDRERASQKWKETGAGQSGQIDLNDPAWLAADAAQSRLADVDGRIALLNQAETDLLKVMSGSEPSQGYSFLNDPETMDTLQGLGNSSAPVGRVQLGQYMSAEEVVGMIGTALEAPDMLAAVTDNAPSLREGTSWGILPQLRRPLTFLDLMPAKSMDSKTFDYVVESGSLDTAAEVVEGTVKPGASAAYTDATATAKTIAHWVKLHKAQLADSDDLGMRLRDRLAYGVLRRLEAQVIAGNGVGPNLRGILNTTGVGSIAFSAGQVNADSILEGIGAVLLSGAQPNVVAISIRDWMDLLKAKATDGTYLSGGAFSETARILWGTTTVPVVGLSPGVALVGDTRLGGRILVREGVNVIVSDSDQDDFTRNNVTLLGEMRGDVIVEQPAAWCTVDLAA